VSRRWQRRGYHRANPSWRHRGSRRIERRHNSRVLISGFPKYGNS